MELFGYKAVKSKSGKVYNVFTFLGIKIKIARKQELYINEHLQKIKPYKSSSHKIWDVRPERRNEILKLDWNEATCPPKFIWKKIYSLMPEGNFLNLYPKTNNKRILNLLARYCGLGTDYIQYFSSSDAIHEYIARMYINSNDVVLIQGPSYDNFRLSAEASGAHIVYSNTDEEFNFSKKQFENDIKKYSPKLVYICSPNNPCGYTVDTNYIEYLLEKYPLTMFLIDEAYFEFCNVSAQNLVLKHENILITRTLSKAFALANIRFGYLLASKNNIKNISKIRNPKNICTFSQIAAIAALSDIQYMKNYVSEITSAKSLFIMKLQKYKQIKVYSSCANFLLLKFESYTLKVKLKNYFEKNNIFVRDLTQSRILYNCLRITVGTKEQMLRVVDIIEQFFNKTKDTQTKSDNDKMAFFDFCETLTNFQTGNAYIYYVIERIGSHKLNFKKNYRQFIDKILFKIRKNYNDKENILGLLKGITKKELDEYARDFYIEKIKPNFNNNILKVLLKLKSRGYKIYIVSGGYDIYLKYFCDEYNINGLFATKIQFNNEACTGKFEGIDCMRENKAKILSEYFKLQNLKKYNTLAFSDCCSDIPLLNYTAKGVAILRKNESAAWADKYKKIFV